MAFALMMFITTINQWNSSVTPKQFRVISKNTTSAKHGSLGIGLEKLRSFVFWFIKLLTQHGEGLSRYQNRGQYSCIFIEFCTSEWILLNSICRVFIFQRTIFGISAVLRWSDGRLTSTDNLDICCHNLYLELNKTMKIIIRPQNYSILRRKMPNVTIKS